MTQTADDRRNFQLTFRSLTDVVGPDLYAYMTVTRVDGPTGRALMMLNRHGGDRINRPVGLFATTLSRSDADALATGIDQVKWQALPAPVRGDVSAAQLELEYRRGDQPLKFAFSAGNFELLNALSPMMQQLDRLGGTLLANPRRAVLVSVVRTAAGFELVLKNVGTGPVVIADPRPRSTSEKARCSVDVARDEDTGSGFQPPPEFTPVVLKPAASGSGVVTLAPGQSLSIETMPWTPPAPGKYLAKASWTDYAGPVMDPATVMPAIPDPGAEDSDKRPYLIRGAAFSSVLQFTAK